MSFIKGENKMFGAILIGRICRDESLTEEECTSRMNKVLKIWLDVMEEFEGKEDEILALNTEFDYSDKKQILFYDEFLAVANKLYIYEKLRLIVEGKDEKPDLSKQGCVKNLIEFIKGVVKERDEEVKPVLEAIMRRINN